jgi:CRP-like cAMP-binding protein
MIGTSRETVTRILKDFKNRKLITIVGPDLHILARKKLDATIST